VILLLAFPPLLTAMEIMWLTVPAGECYQDVDAVAFRSFVLSLIAYIILPVALVRIRSDRETQESSSSGNLVSDDATYHRYDHLLIRWHDCHTGQANPVVGGHCDPFDPATEKCGSASLALASKVGSCLGWK